MEYYLAVLFKFVIGFLIIIAHLNLSGKTQLSQMTPIDFTGNFVLGGIIGGVIYNEDIPLYQYIAVLLIGVGLISLLNTIGKRLPAFRTITIGDPIPIIRQGRFLMDNINLKRNKIDILSVASQLRSQGIGSFQNIRYAQIEPGGQLTVICDEAHLPPFIVMKDGVPRACELKDCDRDEAWLDQEIQRRGIAREHVFLAEYWNDRLVFVMSDGSVLG